MKKIFPNILSLINPPSFLTHLSILIFLTTFDLILSNTGLIKVVVRMLHQLFFFDIALIRTLSLSTQMNIIYQQIQTFLNILLYSSWNSLSNSVHQLK